MIIVLFVISFTKLDINFLLRKYTVGKIGGGGAIFLNAALK